MPEFFMTCDLHQKRIPVQNQQSLYIHCYDLKQHLV